MALSKTTQDHDEIRQWAEARGGKPAEVTSTGKPGAPGILRFEFPSATDANDANLNEIQWEEFFEKFDASGLSLVYQEVTSEGAESNFNRLVYPENVSASARKSAGIKTASARGNTKKAAPAKANSEKANPGKAPAKAAAEKAIASTETAAKTAATKPVNSTAKSTLAKTSQPSIKSTPAKISRSAVKSTPAKTNETASKTSGAKSSERKAAAPDKIGIQKTSAKIPQTRTQQAAVAVKKKTIAKKTTAKKTVAKKTGAVKKGIR